MNPPLETYVALWLAAGMALCAAAAGFGALTARSTIVMSLFVAACGLFCAGALALRGTGLAALAQAQWALGVAPFFMLAGVVLTARTAKPRRGGAPWTTLIAGGALGLLLTSALAGAMAHPPHARLDSVVVSAPFWLAPLIAAAGIIVVGCLGYGERGLYGRRDAGAEERVR